MGLSFSPAGGAPPRRSAARARGTPGRLQPRTGADGVPDAPSPRPFAWRPVTCRKVKGGEVRYLQLGRNEWGAAARRAAPMVLYSFGGRTNWTRRRSGGWSRRLARLLGPADALAPTARGRVGVHRVPPTAADGLGGHCGGEVASAMVARQLAQIGPLLDSEDRGREARSRPAAQTTSPSRWSASVPRAAAV
jgi:hypothetical protein